MTGSGILLAVENGEQSRARVRHQGHAVVRGNAIQPVLDQRRHIDGHELVLRRHRHRRGHRRTERRLVVSGNGRLAPVARHAKRVEHARAVDAVGEDGEHRPRHVATGGPRRESREVELEEGLLNPVAGGWSCYPEGLRGTVVRPRTGHRARVSRELGEYRRRLARPQQWRPDEYEPNDQRTREPPRSSHPLLLVFHSPPDRCGRSTRAVASIIGTSCRLH